MGGGGVQSPKQVTLGESVRDIANTQGETFGTESLYQPQYQQLGQNLSEQSLYNFGNKMGQYINPYASMVTGQQMGYQQGLYNQYAPGAEQSFLNANPYVQQSEKAAEGLYNQGVANQQTANNLLNSGQGIIGQGTGLINYGKGLTNWGGQILSSGATPTNQGEGYIRNAMNMNNVIAGDPMLNNLNKVVNQNLANFGGVTSQEMNAIDQGTGATFAANGLFNSNPASAAALLNRDQFAQNRLQAWTGLGQATQGLNAQEQQALLGGGASLAGLGLQQMSTGIQQEGLGANIMGTGVQAMGTGVQQQGVGAQMANYAGLQQQMGLGGIQNTAGMVQSGINQLVSPNQYNANLQSLASSFAPGQVTPQIIPQELGTASGLNEFNAQGQFAANAANAQMASQQNAAMMGLGGAGIAALGSIFGGLAAAGAFCWVAREVYGINNIKWIIFRNIMLNTFPEWFVLLYKKYGERFAKFIHDKPLLKSIIRKLMDKVIEVNYAII